MYAIRVETPGGPEALKYLEIADPIPGDDEVLVRVEAIGVNFIDIYHRTGLYAREAPFTPGTEAAGTVEAVGPEVTEVREGDRVAFIHLGSYAEVIAVPARKLVVLPDQVDSRTAAAALLQGMTAQYLTTSSFPLQGGEKVLVHAAAGGAGSMIVQMAKRRGAFVFGTASTAKLDNARAAGVDHVIDYTSASFQDIVLQETQDAGVDVVYDSVGQTTFDGSLEVLRPRGMLVMFGQSSGPVPPFDVLRLAKRSLFLTRPTIFHYIAARHELLSRAADLFGAILEGTVRVRIDREFSLSDAAEAHRLLEGRATAGKLLLIP